ncbi:MAG: right-handed parallel beta-helix repeat-containing protein [Clostridia bacterium]|nr:right-handed parallel beta-helix repeat-containing protein [Clostridia bacterium]
MTLARYPHVDWLAMEHGQFYDANGNPTRYTDNDNVDKALQAHTTIVEYGDEYFDTVTSWHSYEDAFVEGRFTHLWVHDNSEIVSINYETDEVTVPYVGAYVPNDGGLLYFYNIPEELDVPGEYIVDRDAILYYYPEEGFESARFTLAVLDVNMINVNADYITFDNLTLESGRKNAIEGVGNYITVQNCTIRDFIESGIVIKGGYNHYIYTNELCQIGRNAIDVTAGDRDTLTKANSVVCNNYTHDYGYNSIIGYGVTYGGCGITVCHNECAYSNTLAMDSNGPYNITEYNYIHDVAQFFSDGGAIGDGSSRGYGSIFRYNLIENAGTADYPAVSQLGVQAFTVDCDCSGLTIYSNIVHNVTGSGVGISGGRDHNVHNNLFISCGAWALSLDARDMTKYRLSDEPLTKKINTYDTNELWQKAFPELRGIHGNFDPANWLDPMFEAMPANNRFVDNYGMFNKYNRFTTTRVMDYVFLYYDDEIINACCEIDIISAENGNMKVYNSRRDPVIIYTEALAEAEAAGYPIMTVEEFNNIGRIGVGVTSAHNPK